MGNDEFGQDERAFTWKNDVGDELRGQLENFDIIANSMKAGADQLVLLPKATAEDAQARVAALFKDEEGQQELPGVPARKKGPQPVKSRPVTNPADDFSDDIPF